MIAPTAEQGNALDQEALDRESRRRRGGIWIAVALVFVTQIGLAFWLGSRSLPAPEHQEAAPAIQLFPGGQEELLALQDPTLFVLPHRENFSGEAWLKVPRQDFRPESWTEPTLPLPLPPEQLGAAFASFMQTNAAPRFQTAMGSEPVLETTEVPSAESISVRSTLRIEGELAKRHLLVPVHLQPQINPDLLLNTEVQLLVNGEGMAHSAVVIPPGSGNPAVDQAALALARGARFEALKAETTGGHEKITFGKLIFEWQTLPPAPTNAPSPVL
jgi:hypothetical protein